LENILSAEVAELGNEGWRCECSDMLESPNSTRLSQFPNPLAQRIAKSRPRGRRAKLADHAERVEALLAAPPDLTIAELRTRLAAAGIAVSPAAISRFLKACGLTRKKRPRTPPSRSAPTSPPPGAPGARSSRR